MDTFGKRLAWAMERAGVAGPAQMARMMGITRASVGQVIDGTTVAMTAANASKAARLLGVDGYWLATGDGEPVIPLMNERLALSAKAVYIGERLDAIQDPNARERAYALIVQMLDFGLGSPPPPAA